MRLSKRTASSIRPENTAAKMLAKSNSESKNVKKTGIEVALATL